MNAANLDESKGDWQQLSDLDHLWLSILDMDDTAKAADVLFKFATNEKNRSAPRRCGFSYLRPAGRAPHLFVFRRFQRGSIGGTYKIGQPDVGPHAEGGGDSDVIILFSLRPYRGGAICEILDENQEVLSTMTLDGTNELHMAA